MIQTLVALDLETTGLDAERDAIIQVGAVKFRGAEKLGEFSTFVDPGRRIPLEITELTGITDGDVAGAPSLTAVLPRLARFIAQFPIVGHSVQFDLDFLRRHWPGLDNESLDTFELASILLPSAERYSLESLANTLGIPLNRSHQALEDARATWHLFLALHGRASRLPPSLLEELVRHGQTTGWAAAAFFHGALQEAARQPTAETPRVQHRALIEVPFAPPEATRRMQQIDRQTQLDEERLASILDQGGAMDRDFPGFEHRPQQVAMLRRVTEAFNRPEHLMVEAPTGVGKSLAYLIPAVHWAVQSGERVVISTNTINLQEQLYRKDLPELARVLPFKFVATVLKGRSHYLCPARLQAMRRRGPGTREEARVLAKVLVWQLDAASRGGDGDELFLPSPREQAIWRNLSADNEACNLERCRAFHSGRCHYYQARLASEASHLIIINHALLLADVAVQNRALPEFSRLVVDEAHHLEAATTSGLSVQIDRTGLHRQFREIGAVDHSGHVAGLLGDVIGACRHARLGPETIDDVELAIGKIGLAAVRAARLLDGFFDRLEEFVQEQRDGRQSQYAFRMRVVPGLRVQPSWDAVEIAWDEVNVPMTTVVGQLERLSSSIDGLADHGLADADELHSRMVGSARQLAEAQGHLNQMITQPSRSTIYWLEFSDRRNHLSLHAAPLHIGPLLKDHLLDKKDTVVLTSATMRTAGSFDFVRERLHAWDADDLVVGTPFDYKASTLLYLVDDVPEPGKPGHQRAVEQGMVALFKATQGRALALFTSYSQLRATRRAIRAPLAQAGVTVEAQGEGISRGQLLENFRSGERRVLLGTRSFWEGVDVPGQALSCLAIAKLPFSVPTDPVFAARAETYDDPFLEYAIPEAILRFLQGFGRLIRTRTDRGIVAVFDRRLLSRSYGELFVESLPGPTVRRGSLALLPRAAADWLASG